MCNYKKAFTLLLYIGFSIASYAQNDSSFVKRIPQETSGQLNMDATYNRPFLQSGKMPIAIGGYMEANTQYISTNGVSDGFSFQFRRTNLFFSSTIAKKIRFFSELEFEDGTKEINLEAAFVDFEFDPIFNFRGGIIVNPIGAFNQNHDGPRWDFIDRPISATTIIPATLSNVGFGFLGKYFVDRWTLGYEAYLTNGFDDNITANEENRTSLAAGKSNPEKFEESNSGLPMFTGKLAVRNRKVGELGFSYMTGVYNKWKADGFVLDSKRSINVLAVDYTVMALKNKLNITGEAVKVFVDVPDTYSQTFGTEQLGAFVDIVGTVIQRPMLGWEKSKINLALRLEYADYNQGKFKETNGNIGDYIWAVVPGVAFRPVGTTVLRFNYRYQQQSDLLGNPPSKTGAIQFGISSYF
ncbi:MAG: hypothetical protein PHP53_18905 [Prolixibacteraceae bacterium]|nr:hypothetical protein [Prolixibacteraceae bacterium]